MRREERKEKLDCGGYKGEGGVRVGIGRRAGSGGPNAVNSPESARVRMQLIRGRWFKLVKSGAKSRRQTRDHCARL